MGQRTITRKERQRLYRETTRAKALHRQRVKRYAKRNREAVNGNQRRQKLRRRAVGGLCTAAQLEARINYYGRRCHICGCDWDELTPFDKTVDHVIPVSRGGANWPANLRPACRSCNSRKRGD